jgi:hypothetical protein
MLNKSYSRISIHMRVNFSIITIAIIATVALLFGTTIMATNTAWGTMQRGTVTVNSQSCDSSGDNIKFSYTGVSAGQAVIRDNNGVALASNDNLDGSGSGTILLPNPIPTQQVNIYAIDPTYGVYAKGSFTPNCGASEHKK